MNLDNEVNTFDINQETFNSNSIPQTTNAQERQANQDILEEKGRKRSDNHPSNQLRLNPMIDNSLSHSVNLQSTSRLHTYKDSVSINQKEILEAPIQPVFKENIKVVSSQRSHRMVSRGSQVEPQGVVVKGKVFQMNIKDESNSYQPAVVLRHPQQLSPRGGGNQSQRQRPINSRGSMNDPLRINSLKDIEDASHAALQQEQKMIVKEPSSKKRSIGLTLSSPKLDTIVQSPLSTLNADIHPVIEPKLVNRYDRTRMTQRFSNSGIYKQIGENKIKASETPREEQLPRLNFKSKNRQDSKSNKNKLKSGEENYKQTNSNIFIQELKMGNISSTYQIKPLTGRPMTQSQNFSSFEHTLRSRRGVTQSGEYSPNTLNQKAFVPHPLVQLGDYEVLSDDNCITKNSYHIVRSQTYLKNRKAPPSKVVFKVVSPKRDKSNSSNESDDKKDSKLNKNKNNRKQTSIVSSDDDMMFYHQRDGTIKTEKYNEQDPHDQFRDFITIGKYFLLYSKIKAKYQRYTNAKKLMKKIKHEEFIILKGIYPRIFSIKNNLKGTVEAPDVEFNPTQLTQNEIFQVKSIIYLYTHQYDKAEYFIENGIKAWPSSDYEFKFNQGLLHYLKAEYSKSVEIYSELLKNIAESLEDEEEEMIFKVFSVYLNLILSFIMDGQRYSEILKLQKGSLFRRIRMLTHPTNLKIQQLLNFCTLKFKLLKERGTPNTNQGIQRTRTLTSGGSIMSPTSIATSSEIASPTTGESPITQQDDGNSSSEKESIQKQAPIQLNFAKFKKRGGNDIPLKNKQQLPNIRLKKKLERERLQIKKPKVNEAKLFLSCDEKARDVFEANQVNKRGESMKKLEKILKNKAQFFNLEKIQDTTSPDYVLTMNEIIGRLQQKQDIQNNKTLLYQLQQLEDQVKKDVKRKKSDDENAPSLQKSQSTKSHAPLIPFPSEPTQLHKAHNQIHDQKQLENAIRNLEELRLEVSMEFGGQFDKCDPVGEHYRIICNSIYALLKEEHLLDILRSTDPHQLTTIISKKASVAKEILLSALLLPKKGRLTLESQTNDQLVELEILRDKVNQLKHIMHQELNSSQVNKSKDYMEKLEFDIKRMLVLARKKQKEREKHQRQVDEERDDNLQQLTDLDDLAKIGKKSLASVMKRQKVQEHIADRFKVDKKKYLESIKTKEDIRDGQRPKSGTLTQQVLKRFKAIDPDQYTKFLERTKSFLQYVFDNYGAFFIAQQTYCLTELLEYAPENVKFYFENTASILTTIPMRFRNLAEAFDENKWADLCKSEFIYNKDDIMYQLISQGLRQPKVIEYMGLEKHEWLLEVSQKFNMLALLNSILRESLKVFSNGDNNEYDIVDEDPDQILMKGNSSLSLNPKNEFLQEDSLQVIKDQYAKLKYQGSAFNTVLIDKLLGKQIPMLKQFNKETREKIYPKCHLRSIIIEQKEQVLDIEKFNKNTTLIILRGNIEIQILKMVVQKERIVEKVESNKKRVQIVVPAGPPIPKWVTKFIIGPTMSLPVIFLHWFKQKNENFRIVSKCELDDSSESENLTSKSFQIDYLEFQNKDLSGIIYDPVYNSLIKKVELIQNVDLFNGDSPLGLSRLDKLSPYVMFVLAAICKVQVFNMSELIISQNEIPKCMFVILEGQAKAVYEDKLERKGEVCPYSRRSLRTDLPKELKFGLRNFSNSGIHDKALQVKKKKNSLEKSSTRYEDLKIKLHEDNFSDFLASPRQSTTFQNLVFNEQWSEHQPVKKLSFRHHIEFGLLTEGSYLSSRVVLDEGAIKNFIKTSKKNIKEWITPPEQAYRSSVTQTIKSGFIETQKPIHFTGEKDGLETDDEEVNQVVDEQSQKSQQFVLQESFKGISKLPSRINIEEETEVLNQKAFLLSSQLSIVVVSSTLKAMVMYKQDKSYFHESVKKVITEMICDKNFIDLDRPLEQGQQIDFIRQTQHQWEKYKYKYEEHSLRESFHQKYERYPR